MQKQNRQQANRTQDHWLNRVDRKWMVIVGWHTLRCIRGCSGQSELPSPNCMEEHLEGHPESYSVCFVANPSGVFEYNEPAATKFGAHLLVECDVPIEPSLAMIAEIMAELGFKLIGKPLVMTPEEYREEMCEVERHWALYEELGASVAQEIEFFRAQEDESWA